MNIMKRKCLTCDSVCALVADHTVDGWRCPICLINERDKLKDKCEKLKEFADKALLEFYRCASAWWDTQEDLEITLSKITGENDKTINVRLMEKLKKGRKQQKARQTAQLEREEAIRILRNALDSQKEISRDPGDLPQWAKEAMVFLMRR